MKPAQIVGLVLLAVGIVLLVLGIRATQTLGEGVREELTGEYSGSTIFYLVAGAVGIVLGGALAIFGGRLGKN